MSRIEVVYATGAGGLEGAVRWLDDTGRLFKYQVGGRHVNSGFVPTASGGWSDGDTVVQRPVGARTTAVAAPAGTQQLAGLKFDGGKPRWTLLTQGCPTALEGVVKVLTFGAQKYAAHSWREVEDNVERYRDALYRHLNAIERGEVLDPESGLPHWHHVTCNAMFLSELTHEPAK